MQNIFTTQPSKMTERYVCRHQIAQDFPDLLTCRNIMRLSVLSAVTSIYTPRHTENPPRLPNTHPLHAKSNSQELVTTVTSVDHVKFGLSAPERSENEKTGRGEGNIHHQLFFLISTRSSIRNHPNTNAAFQEAFCKTTQT